HRERSGGVRSFHDTRRAHRRRPGARTARLARPQRVQAHVSPAVSDAASNATTRMSPSEAIMWAVEKDPALRSDFCNLTLLDHRPSEEGPRQTLARGVASIPRLRQRVIGAPFRIVPPEFAEDPTLDVEAHVRVVGVPLPGGIRELLELCGSIAEQPLDRARPL